MELKNVILNNLEIGPHHFPEDSLTEFSENFFISEIIREKAINRLGDELPYRLNVVIEKINDSKKLSEKKREKLFDYIIDISKFGIGICTVEEIDHLGIQQAVKVSMIRAVESLEIQPDHLLIDNMKLKII